MVAWWWFIGGCLALVAVGVVVLVYELKAGGRR